MRIAILFLGVAVLMAIGMSRAVYRNESSLRSKYSTAITGLVGLAMLTQDVELPVLYDVHHIAPFFGALVVLCTFVAPVFRRAEEP